MQWRKSCHRIKIRETRQLEEENRTVTIFYISRNLGSMRKICPSSHCATLDRLNVECSYIWHKDNIFSNTGITVTLWLQSISLHQIHDEGVGKTPESQGDHDVHTSRIFISPHHLPLFLPQGKNDQSSQPLLCCGWGVQTVLHQQNEERTKIYGRPRYVYTRAFLFIYLTSTKTYQSLQPMTRWCQYSTNQPTDIIERKYWM